MNLVDEIEISYFRSFYKVKFSNLNNLNVIFGKNDSGKSNIVRALNLFFSGRPDHTQDFDFGTDFCVARKIEADSSEDVRKFLYVKITFNTPPTYQKSLGKKFYVKRQWTVSRGDEYTEEISSTIPQSRRHIVSRFINKIRFMYIPAIKDESIFAMLLSDVYETLAGSTQFEEAMMEFTAQIQNLTGPLFQNLPREISAGTKIGSPTQMVELFRTLDFETLNDGITGSMSLTRQRGDGIKARHIPEILKYISDNDSYDFHIWGFEEPENSLDFSAAQAEAVRIIDLAKGKSVQIFITTHSPSFYLLEDTSVSKVYVKKISSGRSDIIQGSAVNNLDVDTEIADGFYLPAVAKSLRNLADIEERIRSAELAAVGLNRRLLAITQPIVLTEGKTDAAIISTAWRKLNPDTVMPFAIRSCESGGQNAGSGNGGAVQLCTCLKGISASHPQTTIGVFDCDEAGLKAYALDRNFIDAVVETTKFKQGIHGRSYGLVLPTPTFRKDCQDHCNLPIEYMFSDDSLKKMVNGHQLKLKIRETSTKFGEKTIRQSLEDKTHFKDILDKKVEFAEHVVPSLSAEAFIGFVELFESIDRIVTFDKENFPFTSD